MTRGTKSSRQIFARETPKQYGNSYVQLSVQLKNQKFSVTWRYLLSKLFCTDEPFTEEDTVALFCVYEKMVAQIAKDAEFKKNHFWFIFLLRGIFINLEAYLANPAHRQKTKEMLQSFLSHKRGYISGSLFYGLSKQYKVLMEFGTPKKAKAKNRIAVGYRDKGNARNVALDGSPPWQEIATDEWFQSNQNPVLSVSEGVERMFQFLSFGIELPWHSKRSPRRPSQYVRRMRG